MSADSGPNEAPEEKTPAVADCPLTDREQTRNVILFGISVGLMYLAAPVTYVSLVHAAVCKHLGAGDAVSNLPSGVYLWTTPLPVLVAWYFPQVRLLRPMLCAAFAAIAVAGGLVAAVLLLPPDWVDPAAVVIPVLSLHAAVLGCAIGVVAYNQWEVLGRGLSASRRGQALGLAFGAGPMLAVLASIGSQLLLAGKMDLGWFSLKVPPLAYPWNFTILFAASIPIMGLSALLATWYVVPPPPFEMQRQPFVAGVLGGFGQFFGNRLILITTIAYILVYSTNMVQTNISLYTTEAVGKAPSELAGSQLTLRFGFKVVAGFLLGWLLTRTHPRAGLLVTGLLTLAGVAWALLAPGWWFLISFGIMGAGELFGVYYPNYILSCSPQSEMRRNMALTSLITMPVGFAPVLFGFISDRFGAPGKPTLLEMGSAMTGSGAQPFGRGPFGSIAVLITGNSVNKKFGYQMSFVAALVLVVVAILLVSFLLPARPRPLESDVESEKTVSPSSGG